MRSAGDVGTGMRPGWFASCVAVKEADAGAEVEACEVLRAWNACNSTGDEATSASAAIRPGSLGGKAGGRRRPVASSTTSATLVLVGCGVGSVVLLVSVDTIIGRAGAICDECGCSARSV